MNDLEQIEEILEDNSISLGAKSEAILEWHKRGIQEYLNILK